MLAFILVSVFKLFMVYFSIFVILLCEIVNVTYIVRVTVLCSMFICVLVMLRHHTRVLDNAFESDFKNKLHIMTIEIGYRLVSDLIEVATTHQLMLDTWYWALDTGT